MRVAQAQCFAYQGYHQWKRADGSIVDSDTAEQQRFGPRVHRLLAPNIPTRFRARAHPTSASLNSRKCPGRGPSPSFRGQYGKVIAWLRTS